MTNFDFLFSDKQFEAFATVAVSAERILHIDLSASIVNCRRAMEFAIKWMYSVDSVLKRPYQDNLISLMDTEEFRDIVGRDLLTRMHFIRQKGNDAAHTGKKVTRKQAELCLENLFVFLDFVSCRVLVRAYYYEPFKIRLYYSGRPETIAALRRKRIGPSKP